MDRRSGPVTRLEILTAAIADGDAAKVQALATDALKSFSPVLLPLADHAEASKRFDELTGEFNALAKEMSYLNNESLADRIEDDIALAAPALADGAGMVENWAIPLLSALAGPGAPLLSFGLTVAVKVALAVFTRWASKRLAAKKP